MSWKQTAGVKACKGIQVDLLLSDLPDNTPPPMVTLRSGVMSLSVRQQPMASACVTCWFWAPEDWNKPYRNYQGDKGQSKGKVRTDSCLGVIFLLMRSWRWMWGLAEPKSITNAVYRNWIAKRTGKRTNHQEWKFTFVEQRCWIVYWLKASELRFLFCLTSLKLKLCYKIQ